MAVGDVITVVATGTTVVTYQPAVGVEVVLRGLHTNYASSSCWVAVTDGTTDYKANVANVGFYQCFIGLTNTLYLRMTAGGSSYFLVVSGMQTKGSAVKVGNKVLTGDELKAYREEWLANRKKELVVGKTTTTITLPNGSTKTLVLKEIREDRDDLGDLRGIICVYGEQ
jgi:hypothetical protein